MSLNDSALVGLVQLSHISRMGSSVVSPSSNQGTFMNGLNGLNELPIAYND